MSGRAACLMVQGTASAVGKSLLVAALCRILSAGGRRVAPFKGWNMSLNAAVTPDGLEIGRATAVQARAARTAPRVEMNPILVKPEAGGTSQVVLLGRAIGRLDAGARRRERPRLVEAQRRALDALRADFDVVLCEGAGSPAEVNLAADDLANMHVARLADAPVVLVGDIDRGGVLAHLVGTLELLAPDDRARVGALVINKFRGRLDLFEPGLRFLTGRTGLPVAGVVPWIDDLELPDEDAASLDDRPRRAPGPDDLDVVVVRFPAASNLDDIEALDHEPGVAVAFDDRPDRVAAADLVLLPGSKSTVADLAWLRRRGLDRALRDRAAAGRPIVGLCGGCQMLGVSIDDPAGVEGPPGSVEGLGLLPLATRYGPSKRTADVRARLVGSSPLLPAGAELAGYEIHMGRVEAAGDGRPLFEITGRNGRPAADRDGASSADGLVVGTMIHGLLDDDGVRDGLLAFLRARRGLPAPAGRRPGPEASLDRLAGVVSASLDLDRIESLLSRAGPR